MLTKACSLYRYKEHGSYKYKEQGSQEIFVMFHHHSCIGLFAQKTMIAKLVNIAFFSCVVDYDLIQKV